jgi:uncharacterized protein (DUF433 family)
MDDQSTSVQRSFRLSRRTLELLDATAAASGESRNALADRLLGESVRTYAHPLIRFRQGAAGHRQAGLTETRLYVYQIVSTLRACGGDIDQAADYLGLTARQVRAARDYYADFRNEVDADAARAERAEQEERARWERQQRSLA